MKPDDNVDLYKPGDKVEPGQNTAAPPTNIPESPPAPKTSAKKESVSWTAVEYIDHERTAGWYALLILSTIVIAALVYLLTKEYFATGTIAVLGIIVAIFAVQKPRQITYELSNSGLRVGEKAYGFGLFKSFSVTRDPALSSVDLLPTKRFMPLVSAYFAPEDEQLIVNAIGEHLPYEQRKQATVDKLFRRLRL